MLGRRTRWEVGRLVGRGWKLVLDITAGGGHGIYIWGAIGRCYFWVKLVQGRGR